MMKSIYYILLSYVCMYVALHIKKEEISWRAFAGLLGLMSYASIFISIVCAIFEI